LQTNLKNIQIDNSLPIIICDADEVIFEFMKSFDKYLNNNNMHFSYNSFKLNGNISYLKDNKVVEADKIQNIILDFFKNCTLNMPLIKDSKKTLKELKKYTNIVILSNIPKTYASYRVKCLKNNNMNYNFLYNNGPKGNVCRELEKLTSKKTFFIDDLPNQITSVSDSTKKVITIHFLQNEKLLKILPEVKNSNFNARNWKQVKKIILNNI
tara:strand:- start:14885 stop:15517 length:633 start_codon:yes stop_codon:yes gene_type:complete